MTNETNQNCLVLEDRRKLSLTCVESVDGFSDSYINLTVKGESLKILGDKLKINSFNKSNGNFSAEGEFRELKFAYKSQPFFKKIFK